MDGQHVNKVKDSERKALVMKYKPNSNQFTKY